MHSRTLALFGTKKRKKKKEEEFEIRHHSPQVSQIWFSALQSYSYTPFPVLETIGENSKGKETPKEEVKE